MVFLFVFLAVMYLYSPWPTLRCRPDEREILGDVSFQIPGEIVGASGPGKNTVAKLQQRLHVAELGRVPIDGVDLVMIDPRTLRRQIGVVLQENIVFRRTVRENLALADRRCRRSA